MAKKWVYIDGKRVAVGTAAAFRKLAKLFAAENPGYTLHVRSGLRTWNEQYQLWLNYQNGGTYALHPDAAQAYHVETNPRGGRSLDLYDSGADPGVTQAGTKRANWIKNNAHRAGFWARGYNFGEPWHVEFQGDIWAEPKPSGGGATTTKPSPSTGTSNEEEENMLKGIYYKKGSTYYVALFDTASGFWSEYNTTTPDYNNKLATALKTGNYGPVTASHFNAIKRDMAAFRAENGEAVAKAIEKLNTGVSKALQSIAAKK